MLTDPRPVIDKGGKLARFTADEILVIVRMNSTGKSAHTIAKALSTTDRPVSVHTVNRWLKRATTPNEHLHLTLAAYRADAVDAWTTAIPKAAKRGNHTPAKDLLIATGVIHQEQQHGTKINIVLGTGGTTNIGILPAPPTNLLPQPVTGESATTTPPQEPVAIVGRPTGIG